jgi:hypothetical protein
MFAEILDNYNLIYLLSATSYQYSNDVIFKSRVSYKHNESQLSLSLEEL